PSRPAHPTTLPARWPHTRVRPGVNRWRDRAIFPVPAPPSSHSTESLPGPTASALPKAQLDPADAAASNPTSHRRRGGCAPPALRAGPPRSILDRPADQTAPLVELDR